MAYTEIADFMPLEHFNIHWQIRSRHSFGGGIAALLQHIPHVIVFKMCMYFISTASVSAQTLNDLAP